MDSKIMKLISQLTFSFILLTTLHAFGASKMTTHVFVGKMNNKYEIHMRLNIEGNKITGSYYYTSTFIPIYLEGTKNGSSVTLTEKVNDTITGTFKGSFVNNLFKGNWTNDAGKKLAFSLIKKEWIAPDTDNISGTYTISMSKSEEKEAGIPKGESGYSGTVSIQLLASNKIGFCINYVKGYPGYHIGNIQGIAIPAENGKYTYSQDLAYSEPNQPCQLEFLFKNGKLELVQNSGDSACGFGAGVYVDGTYKKQSKTLDILNCLY